MTIRENVLQFVRGFFRGLATLTDAQVLAGQQTGARPVVAYLTVTVLSLTGAGDSATVWGTREETPEPEDPPLDPPPGPTVYDTTKQSRIYRATVSVQAFGADAIGWLEEAVNDLDGAASMALQKAAGYDIVSIGAADNAALVVDSGWVERAGHDFEVRFRRSGATRDTDTVGEIEAVVTVNDEITVTATAAEEGEE